MFVKIIRYLRYFFYIGINWNWHIAFILVRHEINGEKKYNINTTGAEELSKLVKLGIDISHSTMYMPVSYELLEDAFNNIPGKNKQHFFDIGCGKGRAMCVAAYFGFTKISGIDFSRELCEAAQRNCSKVKEKFPEVDFSVAIMDAAETPVPEDTDCIFLFNPFDDTVMKKVLVNIKSSLAKKPRPLHIIYINPLCINLFTGNGFSQIYHSKKLTYFEVAILKKS